VRKPSPQTGGDLIAVRAKWNLTRRESEVLEILRTGASDKEIASALGVSRSTASKHVENILKKMEVTNRTAAASLSWRGSFRRGAEASTRGACAPRSVKSARSAVEI
jgi:DNA-binding NarL/FixJ family response regulator